MADHASKPVTDLEEICASLRRHLTPETQNRALDALAAGALDRVLTQLEQHEEALLPRGKQRALHELRLVLERYRRQSVGDQYRLRVAQDLIGLANGTHDGQAVDRAALAEWWLRTIQPVKFRHLSERARFRPVLLKDLRRDLTETPLDTAVLEGAFEAPLLAKPIAERVVAAIIGVTEPSTS